MAALIADGLFIVDEKLVSVKKASPCLMIREFLALEDSCE